MRITGDHLGIDIDEEGLLIEPSGGRDFIQLNVEQTKELITFFEMIKAGSRVLVVSAKDRADAEAEMERNDSQRGYM